ncbi:MAG TPA: transglutaminase domain-containing protein [Spirochaetia bacterium]|nr:transglutaminase domain-containing protein [Spirochaetia bacterium]
MKRIFAIIQIIFLLILFHSSSSNAYAIVKFNTDFQNYYRVDPNGNTHVSFVINQKNNLSVVYATDFGLNINETKIRNVKVTDEGTTIIPEVVKTLNQTTISFPFANKIVGKDKVHSFIIEYDTSDIATKYGNTWQINIPRLETEENISSQSVVLTVPENFPAPAYIDPKPDNVSNNTYYFSGNKIGNKVISAVFGQTQFYKGSISYHLINDTKTKVNTEIALPPDTAYQTVYYEKLDPKPSRVYTDDDGNFLAKYTLEPNTDQSINLDFYVNLNLNPKPTNKPPLDKYLQANSIWNYDNGTFTTPEIKNLVSAKAIYDYIVDKMKYDYEKVNRQKSQITPAAESLINSHSAICTDFSNVFVALARKNGIPSRELQGYAISENPDLKPISLTQDVLHSWPEYFNKATNTWIQIDPTWSNTTRGVDYFNKLDFNHIVFAIHGSSPDYPIPAGGYKYKQKKSKDISIEPVDAIVFPEPIFTISTVKQEGSELRINISNSSGVSFSGNTITEKGEYIGETEQQISIPPFGTTEVTINLIKQPVISTIQTKAIIYINGNRIEQSIDIKPSISKTQIFAISGVFLGVLAFIARYIYLRRQKQKTVVYR